MKNARFIALAFLLGALGSRADAFSVSPGRTDLRLPPGQKINAVLTVLNDSPEATNVEATQKNWFLYEANKNTPVTDWLKVKGKSHFRLKPGQSRKVPVTINCPKDAQGLLVGMASFTFRGDHPSSVTPMISVSVYLAPAGTEHTTGEISKLSARIWQHQMVVGAEVTATGNMHLRPTGEFQVVNEKGELISRYMLPQRDPVYPGQTHGFVGVHASNETSIPAGKYILKAHLVSDTVVLDAQRKFEIFPDEKVQMEGEKAPS